jgi:hypothetical protein
MRAKRWILLGAAVFFTTLVVWIVVSLRNDDSTLMVVAGYLKETTCWSADSSAVCVLKTMAKYEKNGRYDDAVSTGTALAQKYPDSFTSGWIYEDISALYLRRARMDSGHAEEFLKQAVLYRDKALPSHLGSPYSLNLLVVLSELIGDLSTAQRCVQYRNSIKLLDRMKLLANEEEHGLARQFKPNLDERQKLDNLLECIDVVTKRVGGKLSASGCQEQHRSPG